MNLTRLMNQMVWNQQSAHLFKAMCKRCSCHLWKEKHTVSQPYYEEYTSFSLFNSENLTRMGCQCQSDGHRTVWELMQMEILRIAKTDIHHVYYKMPPDQRLSLKREIRGGMDSDARSLNWYSFQRWSQPFNTTQSESGSRQEIFFFLYIYIWSDPTAQNEPKILSPAIRLLKYLSKIGILLRTPHIPMKVKTSDLSVQNMVPWR